MEVQKLIIVAYINLSHRVYSNRSELIHVYFELTESLRRCISGLENAVFIPVLNINNSETEISIELQFVNANNAQLIDTEVIAKLEKLAEDITHEVITSVERLEKPSLINKLRMCWSILKSQGFGFLLISDSPITKQEAINSINNSILKDGEKSVC